MKSRSLNFKLSVVVAILIVGAMAIAYIGLSRLSSFNDRISELIQGKVTNAFIVKDIRGLFYLQAIDQRNIILEESDDGMRALKNKLETRNGDLLAMIDKYQSVASPVGKEQITKFREGYLLWWGTVQEIMTYALKNENRTAYGISKTKASPQRNAADQILDQITERQKNEMAEENKNRSEEHTSELQSH